MFKKLLKSGCFHTLVIICVVVCLAFTVLKRADRRQKQIEQLANLGKATSSAADRSSLSASRNIRLALTDNLGGALLTALLNNSKFITCPVANEEAIVYQLQTGGYDFAILELSQIVKMVALGADIQAFFPCYSESKSYGLVSKVDHNAPCRSLAYIEGTPSEYYSLFLYNSSPSVLSADFKHIAVDSAEKAIKLVQSGEIDGVLLNTDDKLPSGLRFVTKFKPQVFHYMLVRRQHFAENGFSTPVDSAQANLDKASEELVKILFSLKSRIQDPGKYGLLTSNLRHSDPAALALLNRKLHSGELKYMGKSADLTSYQELVSEILMDWKQSPEYSFPTQQLSDETIKNRAYNADFALSCRNILSDLSSHTTSEQPENTQDGNFSNSEKESPKSDFQPSTAKQETPSTNEKTPPEPISSPSVSPAAPADSTNSTNNANGPVSDKEIFKEEIEQGLLPETPSVLPATPQAPPLPRQNP